MNNIEKKSNSKQIIKRYQPVTDHINYLKLYNYLEDVFSRPCTNNLYLYVDGVIIGMNLNMKRFKISEGGIIEQRSYTDRQNSEETAHVVSQLHEAFCEVYDDVY